MSTQPAPIEVFYSYAHKDEALRDELEKHLSVLQHLGLISLWHDRQIVAGTDWAQAIDTHLMTAQVILLLISPDFLASDYCYGVEMQRALDRHRRGDAHVIPILLRPVDWYRSPFAHLQWLPRDAKPVTEWDNQDVAFRDIASGISTAIDYLHKSSAQKDVLTVFPVNLERLLKRVRSFFLGTSQSLYHTRERTNLVHQGLNTDDTQRDRNRREIKQAMVDNNRVTVPSFEESDGCFSFGKIKTTSLVLDGNGTEVYLPVNIHTHYDPVPATFFEEVMQAKKQIQQEEEQKSGESWNSEKYHLSKIVIGRESLHENMTLSLWLKPRDHYTGLATRRCLDNPDFRAKYLPQGWDWNDPITGFSCSMGVDMTVISSDGYTFLTQRGQNQSVHQGMFNCSVSEAVSPLRDRSATGQLDLYRCASRGFAEELGLQESVDFSSSDILFLSFTVDTHYALYGLRGIVKVNKSAEQILRNWQGGVKDKMENKRLFPVPFTPQNVCSFVFSHENWTPGGLISLYHALVHEFGRAEVDRVIASY